MCGVNDDREGALTRQEGVGDRSRSLGSAMSWVVNFVIVAVLPMRLGPPGAPLWFFMAYAVVAGCVLALTENLAHGCDTFFRSAVRAYLPARIMIIAVGGLIPFTIGRTFW